MTETTSAFAAELTQLIDGLAKSADPTTVAGRAELWCQVCDLGLATIGIPEEAGGSGGVLEDLVLVVRELCRAGVMTPIVEASTAAYAMGVAEGGAFDTVVVAQNVEVDGQPLTADLGTVPFGAEARALVVIGRVGVGTVRLGEPGVQVEGTTDIAGLAAGRIRLDGVSLHPCSADSDAVLERLALLRSAALLGSADGAFQLTRTYVAERQQFGAPLLKIPAVASDIAQMAIRLQQTRAALDHAVHLCSSGEADTLRRFGAVRSARILSATTATLVARSSHQLHGALGVTREYPLHRYSTALWAWRDADLPEQSWSNQLGAVVRNNDECDLWDLVTR